MDLGELAAGLKALEAENLRYCLDGEDVTTRPSEPQQDVLDSIGTYRYRYFRAGNQSGKCLIEGTEVLTTSGPVPIEDIKPGDIVYDEHGKEIKVVRKFDQGIQTVYDLTNRGQVWATCTENHPWLCESQRGVTKELKTKDINKDSAIKRIEVDSPLGAESEPHAYAIGALLGDGCGREAGRAVAISSGSYHVPAKVAQTLNATLYKKHPQNCTWGLKDGDECHYYKSWCKGRYAHEKTVDLEIIKSWDRDSLLAFVAGVIDTDGSVHVDSWDTIVISCEMQAKPVVEALQYAFLALWQTQASISTNERDKYVNGPTYTIKVANNAYTKRMLHELDQHLVSPHKKWKGEYSDYVATRTNSSKVGVKLVNKRQAQCWDLEVDSPTHLYLLANGLVTHNTAMGAREVAWIFTETHPTWSRPKAWGDEPLLLLVLGKTTDQIEDSIWRKIKPLLGTTRVRARRQGGALKRVENVDNGNVIVFISHNNPSEAAKNVQSFTAHYCWLDEMPGSIKVLEECHRRTQAKRGPFLMTMTPKVINQQIRKTIDSVQPPHGKVFRMHMFDNPIYKDQEARDEILASLEGYSDAYKRTILEGEWALGEEMVYYYDSERMMKDLPEEYTTGWRHVLSVDPALKSKLGMVLLGEDPATGTWHVIRAEYITGVYTPEDMVNAVESRVQNYNIVRRTCDTEPWYYTTASKLGYQYWKVHEKANRKGELMKNLQTALGARVVLTPACGALEEELTTCRWSEQAAQKIVNSSSYHIIDSLQYAVDILPKHDPTFAPMNWYTKLHILDDMRRESEAKRPSRPVRYKMKRGKTWL